MALSPSRIDKYLSCPAQFAYYQQGITARPSTAWHVGSFSHEVLEHYVNSVSPKENRFTMSLDEAMQYTLSTNHFKPRVVREGMEMLRKWLYHPKNPLPQPSKITATEMSFGPRGDKIRGKPVKEEFTFESGLEIHGIIDLLWEDGRHLVRVAVFSDDRWYACPTG